MPIWIAFQIQTVLCIKCKTKNLTTTDKKVSFQSNENCKLL